MNRLILRRLGAVLSVTGKSRSGFYLDVKQGLCTRPVSLGLRSVAWPEHEITAINAARIAGKSQEDIRALVQQLHADRLRVCNPLSNLSRSVQDEDAA